jgi:hypothetical protein
MFMSGFNGPLVSAKAESGKDSTRLPRSSACIKTFLHHTLDIFRRINDTKFQNHTLHDVRVGAISEIRTVVTLVLLMVGNQ